MRRGSRTTAVVMIAAMVGALAGVGALVASRSPEVVTPRVVGTTAAAPPLVAGDWPASEAQAPSTTESPATESSATEHPSSFLAADAVGPTVELFSAPDVPLGETMDNPTWEGLDVVFGVLEDRDEWLQVRVSRRPNGMVAWVRASDVTLRTVPNWIQVEIGARRITVFHADTPLLSTSVAVGKSATPTPVGSFFVDGVVPLTPPHRAYGAGQVSVSGFSPTLSSFGGGVGQIALHGTFATGLLGQETSNGCVRLDNDSIIRVMELAPPGTPVEILA